MININDYDALTIDAQVVHSNGSLLYRGHLKLLTEMNSRTLKFIISDVVVGEIEKTRLEKVEETTSAFRKVARRHSQTPLDNDEVKGLLEKISKVMLTPIDFVKNELDGWLKKTKCEIIDVKNADTSRLLKLYFDESPPFGAGDKKNEFPDAFALLSLENWAIENGSKVLAISQDKDWIKFAETSPHIDVAPSLTPVISQLGDVKPVLREVDDFINAIEQAPDCELANELHECIQTAIEDSNYQFDVQTDTLFEFDDESLELESFHFMRLSNDQMYSVVKVDGDNRIVEVRLSLDIKASVSVTHLHYDREDKTYHALNTNELEQQENYDLSVLIYYSNPPDYQEKMRVLIFDSVELLDFDANQNFGYIDVF